MWSEKCMHIFQEWMSTYATVHKNTMRVWETQTHPYWNWNEGAALEYEHFGIQYLAVYCVENYFKNLRLTCVSNSQDNRRMKYLRIFSVTFLHWNIEFKKVPRFFNQSSELCPKIIWGILVQVRSTQGGPAQSSQTRAATARSVKFFSSKTDFQSG